MWAWSPSAPSQRRSPAGRRRRGRFASGYVYRGSAVPALRGRYVYGDQYTSEIWSLRLSHRKASDLRREPAKITAVTTLGEDARGELYAAAPRLGRIYKLSR